MTDHAYERCQGSGTPAAEIWADDGVPYADCPECESGVFVDGDGLLIIHRRLVLAPVVETMDADEFDAWAAWEGE